MKLVNHFFLVVVFSLNYSYSQAQPSLSPILTPDYIVNTNSSSSLFNEMFWRNLHPMSAKTSLNLVFNKHETIPHTVTANWFNQYILDTKFNNTIQSIPNYVNSLSHFKQSINNIAREVKQHQPISKQKEPLEYHEDLMKIYPNPLYSQSVVKFEIPKSGFGKLSVFDLNGKEIHNIAIGYFDKGTFEERLTRKDLSKGIYLVILSVENYTETKKLVVAR
jgi:hypothetical protein